MKKEFSCSIRDINSLIADNTTDLIAVMAFTGIYRYISPSHRLLGYKPEQLVGKNGLDLIHPEDQARLAPLLHKYASLKSPNLRELQKKNISESIEYRFPDNAGIWHNIEATANLVEEENPIGYNILIISRDVTIRTLADEKLKKLYQAEIELRRTPEDEIKKRAEFFRALVHELKTPLTPIIASSEAVMNLSDDPTMKRLAANAFNGAVRLNSRVDELLDLSRGEMGMLKVNCQPMNLLSLIKELADYVQPQAEYNTQQLTLDIPESLPPVLGDESRLRQVILNLLNNAMKFMPKGGRITIRATVVDHNVVVEVQDTGRGIDESEQKRLFQPYNRIEADRQHFSGLGLGLALCKKLIELHSGEIWCHSRFGQGSTFGFSVAIYKDAALQPNSTSLSPAIYGH